MVRVKSVKAIVKLADNWNEEGDLIIENAEFTKEMRVACGNLIVLECWNKEIGFEIKTHSMFTKNMLEEIRG